MKKVRRVTPDYEKMQADSSHQQQQRQPECSSYLAQVSQPRGHHFYQKCHISNPGGTILTKNVLFPTPGQGA